jgi:hypothetical protein
MKHPYSADEVSFPFFLLLFSSLLRADPLPPLNTPLFRLFRAFYICQIFLLLASGLLLAK